MVSFCTGDSAIIYTKKQLSSADRKLITRNGPPKISSFFHMILKDVHTHACFQIASIFTLKVRHFLEFS